ncbi:MAG TPA: tetratricopeptide repeat protein, partial [Desulfurivibrionaceae bacterium]|nr:tetratricopeptide repeat protein [Desulfurivibrionaceae bacterium]
MSENLSQHPSSGLQHHSSSHRGAAPAAASEILDQALALHRGNRLAEAVALYREVLALAPDHSQAGFNLAAICHAVGDLPGAISAYRQVLQREPDNFQVLYFLAKALSDQGCR